jgi:hypothetical protein
VNRGRSIVLLENLERPLKLALDRMLVVPRDLRPFVIVEDTVTEKFVQFALMPKTGDLFIDLPGVNMNANARWYAGQLLPYISKGDVYQRTLPRTSEASEIAVRIMSKVHELPDCAQIRIREENGGGKSDVEPS